MPDDTSYQGEPPQPTPDADRGEQRARRRRRRRSRRRGQLTTTQNVWAGMAVVAIGALWVVFTSRFGCCFAAFGLVFMAVGVYRLVEVFTVRPPEKAKREDRQRREPPDDPPGERGA